MMCYLVEDTWNDWFEFDTTYFLTIYDSAIKKHEFGTLKIGSKQMHGESRPRLPKSFSKLDDDFFPWGRTKVTMKCYGSGRWAKG